MTEPQPRDGEAVLKMELKAASGYECEEEHRITPEQWGKIQRILHGTEEAPASENRPRWIPVTERLPDTYPFVVRWDDHTVERYCDRYETINWDADWSGPKDAISWDHATHWMPLPEDPK